MVVVVLLLLDGWSGREQQAPPQVRAQNPKAASSIEITFTECCQRPAARGVPENSVSRPAAAHLAWSTKKHDQTYRTRDHECPSQGLPPPSEDPAMYNNPTRALTLTQGTHTVDTVGTAGTVDTVDTVGTVDTKPLHLGEQHHTRTASQDMIDRTRLEYSLGPRVDHPLPRLHDEGALKRLGLPVAHGDVCCPPAAAAARAWNQLQKYKTILS